MKTQEKSGNISSFLRGVFWTLFVGMAAWIAFDISGKVIPDAQGYTVSQREAMNDLVHLSLKDVK